MFPRGGERLEATKFDYMGVNQVIYEENGLKIRSIPAMHSVSRQQKSDRSGV